MDDVDEDLIDAVDAIPGANPRSLIQYDDTLEDAGYEQNGHIATPGMTQQNYRPIDEGGDA